MFTNRCANGCVIGQCHKTFSLLKYSSKVPFSLELARKACLEFLTHEAKMHFMRSLDHPLHHKRPQLTSYIQAVRASGSDVRKFSFANRVFAMKIAWEDLCDIA